MQDWRRLKSALLLSNWCDISVEVSETEAVILRLPRSAGSFDVPVSLVKLTIAPRRSGRVAEAQDRLRAGIERRTAIPLHHYLAKPWQRV